MMNNSVLHKSTDRGHANHGWLKANFSFSFANWYNPEREQFGMLRVLNDDIISAGMGFGTHPHSNMEIITIPLEGDLAHKDSMGNAATIKKGDIQVMSAGTGIQHSEYNPNADLETKSLQIWIFPKYKNVTPRYQQLSLNIEDRHNCLQQILSPDAADQGVWIYQDAWIHLGDLDKNFEITYNLKKDGNGVYVFLLEGNISINQQEIFSRDAYGIWDCETISITAHSNSSILLIEVPMNQ